MLPKIKESFGKAVKLREGKLQRAHGSTGAVEENSETHSNRENSRNTPSRRQSGTRTPKESNKKDWTAFVPTVSSAPEHRTASVCSASECSNQSIESPVEAARTSTEIRTTTPSPRAVTTVHVPVMAAESVEAVDGEDQGTIPTSPIETRKRVATAEVDASCTDPSGAGRSPAMPVRSVSSVSSIAFSGLDTTVAGTSIQFTSGENSPDPALREKEALSTGLLIDGNPAKPQLARAQRHKSKSDDVDHHTAAAGTRARTLSFDICTEDEKRPRKAPAHPEDEHEAPPRHRKKTSEASMKNMSGSSKLSATSARPKAPERRAERAIKSASQFKDAVPPSAASVQNDTRTHSARKASPPSKAREMLASEYHPRTLRASRQAERAPQGRHRSVPSFDAYALAPTALPSSRSTSRSGFGIRAATASASLFDESNRRHSCHRHHHRHRGFRLTPDKETEEDVDSERSVSTAERVPGTSVFQDPEDILGHTDRRGWRSRARSKESDGPSRRSHPLTLCADHHSSRNETQKEPRYVLPRSPVRRRGSAHVGVGCLDAWGLVQKSLTEAKEYNREGFWGGRHPRIRRSSVEALQQRFSTQDVYGSREREDVLSEDRVPSTSSGSLIDRYRMQNIAGAVPVDDIRATSRRHHSSMASRRHQGQFYSPGEAWLPGPPSDDRMLLDHMRLAAEENDTESAGPPPEAATRHNGVCPQPKRRHRRGSNGAYVGRRESSRRQRTHSTPSSSKGAGVTGGKEELSASLRSDETSELESPLHRDAGSSSLSQGSRIVGDREQAPYCQSSPRSDCEYHRASEARESSRAHRRKGSRFRGHHRPVDGVVPEHHTDASRRHHHLEREGCGGSWHSRSHHKHRAPASPAPDSPLRSRGRFFREGLESKMQVGKVRYQSPASLTSSPVRGRRSGSATGVGKTTPPRRASQSHLLSAASSPLSEKELLKDVAVKLSALEQEIADDDAARERAMMQSPFERLYHLNNRRDRDERRKKVFQLHSLERLRDRIVSGSLEESRKRKEERLRKQEEMLTSPSGVFVRLYHHATSHRSSGGSATGAVDESGHTSARSGDRSGRASVNTTAVSSRPPSTARSRISKAESEALSNRLYLTAAATQRKKEAMMMKSVEKRRQQEVEELLIARLAGQILLERSREHESAKRRPQPLAQVEEDARVELERLRKKDPEGYQKKVLQGRVLSPAERDMQAARLYKHGYVSKAKLEAEKKALELKNCTFHPSINQGMDFFQTAARGNTHRKDNERSSGRGSADDGARGASAQRVQRQREGDRCTKLYLQGVQAKERGEALRHERDRVTRLGILRGRMENDHHFKRRVELDPSLAERFMKSLVV
ncbi:hypothetical protein JKF63_00138 [Porcisia hertigi]|uniref:Uncharacterized protein n=1 Tax=Porcisia hertigi TaxID=2761500 RepID=A0A836HCL4_9TRYP|nr:hypothetical protein JKF63_00138 [Porcisia hertigi]